MAWILLLGHMNYLGAVFILLEVEKSFRFFHSFYYFIFWFPVLVIIISKAFKPRRPRAEKKEENGNMFNAEPPN